ncbi:MAG: hypothetical protein RBS32_11275 [Aliarcobacter sp.]|nr:hypothetical protein [Aliarcobacter sp.]
MEENKLVRWFENYFENKPNEEYLHLQEYHLDYNINSNIKEMRILFKNATIINLENFIEHHARKNYILYNFINNYSESGKISSATWLRKNNIQIICVEYNKDLLNAIKSGNINEIRKLKYNFIEKIDFHNILQIEDIKSFLEKRNCEVSCLLEKDFLELDKLFNTEIELFKKHKILTANLANRIYKLCQLDFFGTSTDIGNKIKKILNSKSKSITSKVLREYLYNIGTSMPIKQTRVYDLNINQIEFDTKIKIAKNLLFLKKEKLDYKTIAKVTELPEKDVLKLIKKIQSLNFNN